MLKIKLDHSAHSAMPQESPRTPLGPVFTHISHRVSKEMQLMTQRNTHEKFPFPQFLSCSQVLHRPPDLQVSSFLLSSLISKFSRIFPSTFIPFPPSRYTFTFTYHSLKLLQFSLLYITKSQELSEKNKIRLS